MPPLRWTPLFVSLVVLGASTCRKSDPGETKPTATPEVTLPGVDTSSLTPRERRDWAGQVSELLAPCKDVPLPIAQCAKENRPCKTCLPAAQFLLKQVQAGKPKKDREEAFHARFDPDKTKTLVTDGSPEHGAKDPVVTIVEWADFECPFCALAYPMLEQIEQRFEGQVKVVYKFYPLGGHPHGEIAARAAIAAMDQGKFWEMHHMLFENQQHLEPPDLEKYARQLGLNLAQFKADMASRETTERIEKDRKQADEIGLEGTPFIFINGREANLQLLNNVYEDLEDWVKLDIELAGSTPRPPPPKGSASAAAPVPASVAASASAAAPAASTGAAPSAAPAASAGPSAPRPPGKR